MQITTSNGEVVTVLPNVLNLRHNSICRTQHGIFMLVHNNTKKVQLVFEPNVHDSTIQGCCFAIERYGDILPQTLTISNFIPPINENL
jgi:hypothetical protein